MQSMPNGPWGWLGRDPGSQVWAGNGAGAGHVRRVGQQRVQQIKKRAGTEVPACCNSAVLLTKRSPRTRSLGPHCGWDASRDGMSLYHVSSMF
ncbi:hypothetical protein BaRGS_00025250 [Batillaria attramentaria]|uniref:Uncharacterized protein n=1 Tax=Batillaria attramentaria TaxID=370345 RepID=A0ABD0K8P2_9CAEN